MKNRKRILSGILVIVLICVGMIGADKLIGIFHKEPAKPYNPADVKEVTISLDEWIGWKSLIYANGGLTTTSDSINARNGIRVRYVIKNDPDESSDSLISGNIQGAGYTINRYAFLQNKFDEAQVKVVMPYITSYSNGGDGIIASSDIKSVADLVGKKIAVPRNSDAHSLVEWLITYSSLTEEQIDTIRSDMVYFETADQTAAAFFAGRVDAAVTWEPYLSIASSATNSRILFDTSMGTNLIIDGLVFRVDFLEKNEKFIIKLIDGALEANQMYLQEFKSIKAMPVFGYMNSNELKEMCDDTSAATWADNKILLSTTALTMYREMAYIWKSIGEKALPEKAESAFETKYIDRLYGKYSNSHVTSASFSQEGRQAAQQIPNDSALYSVSLDIKFDRDSFEIESESLGQLDEFLQIAGLRFSLKL